MFLLKLRNRHFLFIDLLILLLTPTLALILRLDTWRIPDFFWLGLLLYTLAGLLVRPLVFRQFGLYSRLWRYASVDELVQIGTAVLVSSLILSGFILILRIFFELPFARTVLIIDPLLVLIGIGGVRFSVRFFASHRRAASGVTRKVIIMGAGDAGEMVARELQRYPQFGLEPVAFLDDDPSKQQLRIRGLPVLGGRRDIPRVASKLGVDLVVLAIPLASGEVIREITGTCELLGIETKIIPSLQQILLTGSITPSALRNVQIEDLLRREAVHSDIQAVRELVAGRRVLVTGGGGSIGSELCRQLLLCGPSELLILGHGENSVFEITQELRQRDLQGPKITPLLADVRFTQRIHELVQHHQPDIIFHAAAHKHVPLMEANPGEAVSNNVLGTRNLLDAALAADVEHFVFISTDKAVNPTSIMGATKRTAELLVHQAARASGKPYVAVRFGNVLGSRGSVVLTFQKQIAAGGPVTVTHPDIARYFMTIPEAVQLVLQAAALGSGGEVFVLDMGEPVKIVDLARDLIRLSGYEPERDIEIRYIGLRPGEKLFEELFVAGEAYDRTAHAKIFIARNASSFVPQDLNGQIDVLATGALRNDREAIMRSLGVLVPEYNPPQMTGKPIANDPRADSPALSMKPAAST